MKFTSGILHTVGYHTPHTGIISQAMGCQGYRLLLLQQTLVVRLHGIEQECPAGSLLVWTPGEPLYYGLPRATWEHTWLVYQSTVFRDQLDILGIQCNRPLFCANPSPIDDLFKSLAQEFHHAAPDVDIVQHLFDTIWLVLRRQLTRRESGPPASSALQDIKVYLDAHFTEPIQLQALVAQYHLSMAHFCREFKREYGLPAMKYVTQLRMNESRRLLQEETGVTVAEVAYRIGYLDSCHFSHQFHTWFGESPSAWRKRMQHGADKRAQSLMHQWEGGRIVCRHDFSTDSSLDPRWQAYSFSNDIRGQYLQPSPEQLRLYGGRLHFLPSSTWTNLRWEEEISEECRVEMVLQNTNASEGVNLAISLSGDLRDGYRLRLTADTARLETIRHGYWEVLCNSTQRLAPDAPSYHIAFWREGDEFFAEINGERVLAYYDPRAPYGPRHRTVAIGRFSPAGTTVITALCVLARPHTLTYDALEPGRVLLRKGYFAEAHPWFVEAARELTDPRLQQEAGYFAMLALPEDNAKREAGLLRISGDDTHAFRLRALRALSTLYADRRQFPAAVEAAVQLATLAPAEDISTEVACKLVEELRQSPTTHAEILSLIARLPLTHLNLVSIPLPSLAPLAGMALRELRCDYAGLLDVSPLQGMPLTALSCCANQVSDISPLAGLPLVELSCIDNRVTDLSLLHGMPLQYLNCCQNQIDDLSPLRGMPLKKLLCGNNNISDLSPICGMPITELTCSGNRITDLSPLRGMPISELSCGNNRITDLTPLRALPLRVLECAANAICDLLPLEGLALTRLNISSNQVTDLAPLCRMPLTELCCEHNPLTDLSPLAYLPLTSLSIEGIALEGKNCAVVAALPLRHLQCDPSPEALQVFQHNTSLQSINQHHREHAEAVWPAMSHLLVSYQANEALDTTLLAELRAAAVRTGDCAYLCLPCQLPFPLATAFAEWLGGHLPCPSSIEQCQRLHEYVTRTTLRFGYLRFFLGLRLHPSGEHRWGNGEAYTLPYLPEIPDITEASCAYFRADESGNIHWNTQQGGRCYVVIEWRDLATLMVCRAARPRAVAYRRGEPLGVAISFLQEYLTVHPAAPAADVFRQAHAQGIADITLKRAKRQLAVESWREGFGNGGAWLWRLPVTNTK